MNDHHTKEDYPFNEAFYHIREMQIEIDKLKKLSLQQQERIEEQDRMINILERERK